ncbi:MAG TPA: glycosyltransferase, partial [Verrucomicrobiae bacterium]|nr:glycosyltransferase [Verrucomicrobiae bacterium]
MARTLFDLSRQTYKNFEILIGDDASTDNTAELIAKINHPQIRYFQHAKNLGIYPNWNFLIQQSHGALVCIFHDHDIYLPTILERSIDTFRNFPSVQFVHSALIMVDDETAPLSVDIRPFPPATPGGSLRKLIADSLDSPVMAATAVVRREAYDKAGLYDPTRYGLG